MSGWTPFGQAAGSQTRPVSDYAARRHRLAPSQECTSDAYSMALHGMSHDTLASVEIVRATAKDAASVADVWLRSRKASVAIPPAIHSDEGIRAYVTDVLVPLRETWVAVEHGVMGRLVFDDDYIDQLYVDPGHQRRGVGAALLEHAKRQRPSGLQLWTFQSNADARRFYERHGFVAVEETEDDNEERAPDVRYTWRP